MKKKKIFLAIPNLGTNVVELTANILHWTHDPRYDIIVKLPKNIFPLAAARNTIVKDFLEHDYDYIWWIDDDIVPPISALDRLIEADKDFIGAACFSMKYERGLGFPYPVTLRYNKEKKYIVYYGKGIEEYDATGGACLLIKRKVYESIKTPYQFHYHKDGTLSLTCDFDFCQKVQKAGFKIYIDNDIICSHIKEVDIKVLNDLLIHINNGK